MLEKCHSTTHSFLKGLGSLCYSRVSSIILHCSISPCFWKGVHVACQTFLLSSCIAFSSHTTREKLFYPHSLFWEGIALIYIPLYLFICWFILFYSNIFLSRIFSIILHCPISPCFWEGVDVACQTFLLSSCIALSFHITRKNYSTLFRSFDGRFIFSGTELSPQKQKIYIFLSCFQVSLLSSLPSFIPPWGGSLISYTFSNY